MSAKDALGQQFIRRRAEQLAAQGQDLVRFPKVHDDSREGSKSRHPSRGRGPQGVIEGGDEDAQRRTERLKKLYTSTRDSGMMDDVAQAMRDQMTPEERRAAMRRRNRPQR